MLRHARTRLAALACALVAATAPAQPRATSDNPLDPPANGVRRSPPNAVLLHNCTVHPRPGERLEDAAVLIRDGRVVDVGVLADLTPPPGVTRHDLGGRHVYAAFVDAYVEIDAPKPNDNAPGRHWNPLVTPERRALDGGGVDADLAQTLRSQGFAAAAISPEGGIFRGKSAVVSLAADAMHASAGRAPVYRDQAYHAIGFDVVGWSGVGYPTSHIGAIAQIRQVLSDAAWRAEGREFGWLDDAQRTPSTDASALDTLERETPLLFDAAHELKLLHAGEIVAEADRDAIVIASGTEFRALSSVRDTELPLIVPLRYPSKPDVSSPGAAESVELRDMMTWEQAPTNARRLIEAGATVALTTHRLRNKGKFLDALDKAVAHGLRPDDALAALTTTPAELLGLAGTLGSIQPGAVANLLVTDNPLFIPGEDPDLMAIYIDGHRHQLARDHEPFEGTWDATLAGRFKLTIQIDDDHAVTILDGDVPPLTDDDGEPIEIDAESVKIEGSRIRFAFDHGTFGFDAGPGAGYFTMSGELLRSGSSGRLVGTGLAGDNSPFEWAATRRADEPDDPDEAEPELTTVPDLIGYPFGPYAIAEPQPALTAIYTGATVWTSDTRSVEVYDPGVVVVDRGRIAYVGDADTFDIRQLRLSGEPVEIDCTGKHITPGIIDAHSHTGLFALGVNEAGQAVTSEVRIADSLDPTHINWYRQLAGGVTTVLSLHGSANPIGGQSQVHKVRWGSASPAAMRFKGATPGIKFALGENVKQSNWGDDRTTRYPQTRMGVETIMRDRFHAAIEYARARRAHQRQVTRIQRQRMAPEAQARAIAALPKPRRDLELEPLVEILRGTRRIHCHSYRQDEILMLCQIADDFGFKIGTFQHGLEVYKVAEHVREHAFGASLFADWWAYKFEVFDAVAGAGPLQSEVGVLTSYNSDSDELARRMHLEAAKAIRYAHPDAPVSPAEALRYVTINPAIQLGIEQRVGSIEMGKDADLVVWSAEPLSTFARPERVLVDGRELFSLEQDAEHRETIARERARLIQKLLSGSDDEAGESSAIAQDPSRRLPLAERMRRAAFRQHALTQLRRGWDPDTMLCGDCGCNLLQAGGLR